MDWPQAHAFWDHCTDLVSTLCVVRPTVYATVMTKSLSVSRLHCSLWHTRISSGEVSRFPSLEALTLSMSIHWVKEGMCGLLLCSALTVKTWTLAWRGKALKQPAPALWTFTSLRSSSNLKTISSISAFFDKSNSCKKNLSGMQVFSVCLAPINVTFQRPWTQGRPGEMMATKGSLSCTEPFPHADLNPLLCPLSPGPPHNSVSDIQPSSRLHTEKQKRVPSQGVNPAGLHSLLVLKNNEIW